MFLPHIFLPIIRYLSLIATIACCTSPRASGRRVTARFASYGPPPLGGGLVELFSLSLDSVLYEFVPNREVNDQKR